jgi:hypothetical protein
MHRHRVWNTASTLIRTERNRVLNLDGFIPAVNTLYFDPVDPVYDVNTIGINTVTPTFYFSYLDRPVQFKYQVVGFLRNISIYWKKNNGSFNAWTSNTFNGVSFSTGDSLTVGISVTGADPDLSFSLTLFNNLDTLACSNTLAVLTADLSIGPPEFP